MKLDTESYTAQAARWPASGRHILAQVTGDAVVVYQAYRPAVGLYAARYKHFGGEFSLSRMSWIKPNFLWTMYRSGWGTKEWDPDHSPSGGAVARRAVQLGLRGVVLARYARDWIIDIEDISDFVAEQRVLVQTRDYARLITPREAIYLVHNRETAARIDVSPVEDQ